MREEVIHNILEDINRKEALVTLKNDLSEKETLSNLDLYDKCKVLLHHEDPKIRKNVALILGHYRKISIRAMLLNAYKEEKTDFVKEAYLKALTNFNCKSILNDLIEIQHTLLNDKLTSTKHIQAQLKVLNPLILKNSEHKKKMLKLIHDEVDVILTTLPYYQFTLFEYVLKQKYKPVGQGVLVRTKSLYDLFPLRNYNEIIIPLKNCSMLPFDEQIIAQKIKESNLITLLDNLFDDEGFFYYHLTDNLREKNSQFISKLTKQLLNIFPTKLLNTKVDYDIELVLRELKKGSINVYLKLTCVNNPRFAYRKEIISNSMQPYVANTLLELAKPYFTNYSHVLDPFCGSGVLLIERSLMSPVKFALGLDTHLKAIDAAKKNTKGADVNIHYVNKDANRFVVSDLFDEIVTDMPTYAQLKDKKQLDQIYSLFFKRLPKMLKPKGYAFIYTSEIGLIEKNLRLNSGYLNLVEHYDIPRGKNMFYFFIIQIR